MKHGDIGDLDLARQKGLRAAIESDSARHMFVPDGMEKLMRASGVFPWTARVPSEAGGALRK